MNTSIFHLLIQTNSPGELASWALPFAEEFKKLCPQSSITLLLTPCPYATGQEYTLARQSPWIDMVYMPRETIRLLFFTAWFQKTYAHGAVLSLGGDPFYSKLFGLKYRLPVFIYTERPMKAFFLAKKIFLKSEVGDLMYTRIAQRTFNTKDILAKYRLEPKRYCLFFCGSRRQHFLNFLPFMAEVVLEIKKRDPAFSALLHISPFISAQDIDYVCRNVDLSAFTIIKGDSLELMHISDLLITLPGTSTAEAMYMKLPQLVVVPLNRPDLIIFDGLLGIVGAMPYVGVLLKKLAIAILKQKKRLYALPNMIAHQEIVPELVDVVSVDSVSEAILGLFSDLDRLNHIKGQLSEMPAYPLTASQMGGVILGLKKNL